MYRLRVLLATLVLASSPLAAHALECTSACDDGDPCTVDACDVATGACLSQPLGGLDAFRCRVGVLASAVEATLGRVDATRPRPLGGAAAKTSMRRQLSRAWSLLRPVTVRLSAADLSPPSTVRQGIRVVRNACGRVEIFRRLVESGVAAGAIAPALGAQLLPAAFDVCRPMILLP